MLKPECVYSAASTRFRKTSTQMIRKKLIFVNRIFINDVIKQLFKAFPIFVLGHLKRNKNNLRLSLSRIKIFILICDDRQIS
jgi:hypothetical protein